MDDAPHPLDAADEVILGAAPSLTRRQVCERADVPLEVAVQLWGLMGFAHVEDDEVVFTPADVEALRGAQALVDLGILSPERQTALVRTWGHSFARLAEWQTSLLASVAAEQDADPLESLAGEVLPQVEALQAYVWRRHLVSAAGRLLTTDDPESAPSSSLSVGFVDIVGYTSRSKELSEAELVSWLEAFESETTARVAEAGGRVIKSIGDEVLFVADDAHAAARAALALVRRGAEDDDPYPAVRAGLAHGGVVHRLGDVYGETVNVAARLTSAARPGTVLVDRGAHDVLAENTDLTLRRVPRLSVKGYARLAAWAVRLG